MPTNPYEPPRASLEAPGKVEPTTNIPIGIGGWLVLVVIGLVITPARVAYMLATTHWPIFRSGAWEQLTTPGTGAYHVFWAPFIAFEVIGNMALLALGLATLFYLLRRSSKTPKMAIIWYAWSAGLVVIDSLAGNLIPAVAAHPDPDSAKELARGIIAAAIWIPYFLVSKRVKATFVL